MHERVLVLQGSLSASFPLAVLHVLHQALQRLPLHCINTKKVRDGILLGLEYDTVIQIRSSVLTIGRNIFTLVKCVPNKFQPAEILVFYHRDAIIQARGVIIAFLTQTKNTGNFFEFPLIFGKHYTTSNVLVSYKKVFTLKNPVQNPQKKHVLRWPCHFCTTRNIFSARLKRVGNNTSPVNMRVVHDTRQSLAEEQKFRATEVRGLQKQLV